MGNSLLDVCVFGRRAGNAAAEWARTAKPGKPTLEHLKRWEHDRIEAGIGDDSPSPMILPDYTVKLAAI